MTDDINDLIDEIERLRAENQELKALNEAGRAVISAQLEDGQEIGPEHVGMLVLQYPEGASEDELWALWRSGELWIREDPDGF